MAPTEVDGGGPVPAATVGKTLLTSKGPVAAKKEQSGFARLSCEEKIAEEGGLPTNEEIQATRRQQALTQKQRRWSILLVAFSGWDLIASACIVGTSLAFAYKDDGVSLYCLCIQALSHLLCSFVIILRFIGELLPPRDDNSQVSDGEILQEQRHRDLRREQLFAIVMGIGMLVSCAALLFKAFRKIKFWDQWYLDHSVQDQDIELVTRVMAWVGFVCYLFQASVRFYVGRITHKQIVWHSFAVSVVSLVFFMVLGVAASYEHEWSWKADPIAAVVLVFVMVGESTRILVQNPTDVSVQMRFNSQL